VFLLLNVDFAAAKLDFDLGIQFASFVIKVDRTGVSV
jgi:hypothetical protein